MERIKLLLTLDIDPETGDTVCVNREIINDDIKKTVKKSTKKKKVEDNDTTPRIILEENKYKINNAVVELLGLDLDEENRLSIQFEKKGRTKRPVFGTGAAFGNPDVGNKLTKSLTVACRGAANKELSEYGNEFTLEPYEGKEGLFILIGNVDAPEIPDGDENVSVPEKDITEDDLDLSDFIDNSEDEQEEEVDAFDFNLNV